MIKALPLILLVLGIASGGVAGLMLRPVPSPETINSIQADSAPEVQMGGFPLPDRAFVKVGNQTIVPIVEGGETRALMLFELAIDVPASRANRVHEMEPRLRDAFLQELFRMSFTGAFLTNFTDDRVVEELRRNLTRAAREQIGDDAREVLILDMMRQEL